MKRGEPKNKTKKEEPPTGPWHVSRPRGGIAPWWPMLWAGGSLCLACPSLQIFDPVKNVLTGGFSSAFNECSITLLQIGAGGRWSGRAVPSVSPALACRCLTRSKNFLQNLISESLTGPSDFRSSEFLFRENVFTKRL